MNKLSFRCAIFSVISTLPLHAFAQSEHSLSQLMEQWLNIESQKGQLQRSWSTQKQNLAQKLTLLKVEKKALQALLTQSSHHKSDLDSKRVELVEQQNTLEQEQQVVNNKIQQTSNFIFTLLPQLPPPLQLVWQEKLLLLNQDVSASEKLERLLSSFKLVSDFDNRIAVNKGSMELPQENGAIQNVLVSQVYLGLSQGWYISDDGHYYGYGRTSPSGWLWWHNEDASQELGQAIDKEDLLELIEIIQSPTNARFISLPIKIKTNKDIS